MCQEMHMLLSHHGNSDFFSFCRNINHNSAMAVPASKRRKLSHSPSPSPVDEEDEQSVLSGSEVDEAEDGDSHDQDMDDAHQTGRKPVLSNGIYIFNPG